MSPFGPTPSFADPLWLAALAALPLLAWWHHRRGPAGAITYSRLPAPGPGVSRGGWRLHLPFYVRLLALLLLVVGLARPRLGYAWEETTTEGMDIEIALDVSGSMGAEDFQPDNRLTVAKRVVADFIAGRPGDRLGLVIFSGAALNKAPLTTDRRMLAFLLDSVEIGTLPRGTAIGMALATAAARLEESTAESRIIVLVTDGANNTGEIDPRSAAALCAGLGLKVYTVGVGTGGEVPIPVAIGDPLTGRPSVQRVMRRIPVDEGLLREIAERTGGRYFLATDPAALAAIFDEIDTLEKSEIAVKRFVRYREVFQPLAWAALGLILLPLAPAALKVTAEP